MVMSLRGIERVCSFETSIHRVRCADRFHYDERTRTRPAQNEPSHDAASRHLNEEIEAAERYAEAHGWE